MHLFAKDYMDLDKPCQLTKFTIETTTENPIRILPYRKSFKERKLVQDEVNKMLQAGIIRLSESPWAFPVVLIPKPDGTTRFCVDYRLLNAITIRDPYPLPRIDDILDRLKGSVWFSDIDLKAGYWQVEMDEQSIAKTAFSTPDGHYEFLRLPFGLKNAPSKFSRLMFQIFGNLPFIEIYLDNLTVHSLTIDEHLAHIDIVFRKLEAASLKMNLPKCKWIQNEIKVLGHIINGNNIKMNPEKIRAIEKWKSPINVKQIQQFLGRFIPEFAKIASPMYKLIQKDTEWNWNDECEQAFQTLKNKLITYPVLRQPDLQKKFILETDACGVAIGAILSQLDENKKPYVCVSTT